MTANEARRHAIDVLIEQALKVDSVDDGCKKLSEVLNMPSADKKGTTFRRSWIVASLVGLVVALSAAIACGGGETTVVTVEVPVEVPGETVVQTVVVEKQVEVAGETVIQTVVVEKEVQVAGETVVQTVVVEREVQVAGETVVQTVVVEREVEVAGETVVQTVVVEKEVEVVKEVEKEVVKEVEKEVVKEVVKEVEVEVVVIPTPEPVRVDSPHITADPAENSWPTIYDADGNLFPKPSSFKEAPMLAARVAAGELPPVEERLPENPLVLQPTDGIGKYGGTWYRGFTGPADGQNMERPLKDHLLFYDVSGQYPQPNIAESWTQNEDFTEFTFTLRKGHKWSDGQPFTTADIMFWVDHMLHNEELNPAKPAWTQKGGETLKFEAIDEQTFKVTSPEPYGPFVALVASVIVAGQHTRGDGADGLYAPRHYLEQFHPDFVGLEEANRKAEEAGFENWFTYFNDRNHANANPDAPMLTAWRVTGSINTNEWSFERNPYYYAVDTEGNQLPYIDSVVLTLAQNLEVLNLSALAGNYTVMGRHINIAKLPLFLENAESVGYRIQFWRQPQSGIANLYINETWDGNAEIQSFLQNVELRKALSMAIERDQINEVFFLGIGATHGLCQGWDDPDNPGKYIGEDYVQFNPDAANAILDEIGLSAKDGDGFRLMPSGERLTIQMPAVVAAFEDYPGINEMVARQWAVNIGVHAEVQPLERSLEADRRALNELMFFNWESSPRASVLITPQHLLPVSGGGNTGRLYGDWHNSGGETGIDPTGINDLLKEQMVLYDESQSTASPERFLEIAQQVVELNCLNVNPITTVMNKPTYVAIIKNNVRNIPNALPFSYHSQTSGNGFPEQWWIDDENAMEGQ